MNPHEELWAKQKGLAKPYPLLAHLLDSAAVAGALWDHWLRQDLRQMFIEELGSNAREIIQFVVGSHDIGKATPLFQYQKAQKGEVWDSIRYAIDRTGRYQKPLPSSYLVKKTSGGPNRHEQWSSFASKNEYLKPSAAAKENWIGLAIGGHHGRFEPVGYGRHQRKAAEDLAKSGWSAAQQDLLRALEKASGITRASLPSELSPELTLVLSGLTILADRISSTESFVITGARMIDDGTLHLATPIDWLKTRKLDSEKHVAKTVGIYHGWNNHESAIHSILKGYDPRPLQTIALQNQVGLLNLMAPTGNGKTEAAILRHSLKENDRLIFLLPTQATSNAIMRRVQGIYSDTPNVAALAHSLASVEDFYQTPLSVFDDHYDPSKEQFESSMSGGLYPSSFVCSGAARLLAPICIGTVDQALATALPGKWIHLRILALANAHIVIDEVHTLDHYQTALLENILPILAKLKTKITFLTATMPSWQRTKLLTAYGGEDLQIPPTVFPAAETVLPGQFNRTLIDSDSTTIDFTMEETSYDHLVESHVKWHQATRLNAPHARIGLICNTVKRAQEIAAALEKTNDRIVLLHSRMTTEHRRRSAELLESLLGPNGNRKTITVVGTQAIEASLDIDLDILRTELCPAPSLVQRAGRVWRRNDPYRSSRITADHKPISVVFIAEAEDWQVLPYLRAETSRTQRWLEKHNQMFLPQMAQEFIDAATVDLDTATSEMDLDALALMGIHLMKADGAKARIQDVLNSDSKVSDFALLTSKNEIDEAQTRLIEEGTHLRIILGDENESIPGGWKHGLSSLLKLKASDRESLRTALLASIPLLVSEKQKQLLYQHNLVPLSSSKTVLAGFYFLPKAQNFYSKNLGFIWPEEKD